MSRGECVVGGVCIMFASLLIGLMCGMAIKSDEHEDCFPKSALAIRGHGSYQFDKETGEIGFVLLSMPHVPQSMLSINSIEMTHDSVVIKSSNPHYVLAYISSLINQLRIHTQLTRVTEVLDEGR